MGSISGGLVFVHQYIKDFPVRPEVGLGADHCGAVPTRRRAVHRNEAHLQRSDLTRCLESKVLRFCPRLQASSCTISHAVCQTLFGCPLQIVFPSLFMAKLGACRRSARRMFVPLRRRLIRHVGPPRTREAVETSSRSHHCFRAVSHVSPT